MAQHHVPSAFNSLVEIFSTALASEQILDQERAGLFAKQWARKFDLQGTWVEACAANSLFNWVLEPPYSVWPNANADRGLLRLALPDKAPLWFKTPWVRPLTSGTREAMIAGLRAEICSLCDLIEGWINGRLKEQSLVEIEQPTDWAKKLECAALYYFARLKPEVLVVRTLGERKGLKIRDGSAMVGSRETVNRWLKEVSEILELPIRRRGWRTGGRPVATNRSPKGH